MKRFKAVWGCLGMVVLLGCETLVPEPPEVHARLAREQLEKRLMEQTWQWRELQMANQKPVPVLEPARYTLDFEAGGKIRVLTDCNRGQGNYRLEEGQFRIGALRTTLAACPPESWSDKFLTYLQLVERVQFDTNHDLLLELADNIGILRFRGPYQINTTPSK
jgi:heat shock protein HslJ